MGLYQTYPEYHTYTYFTSNFKAKKAKKTRETAEEKKTVYLLDFFRTIIIIIIWLVGGSDENTLIQNPIEFDRQCDWLFTILDILNAIWNYKSDKFRQGEKMPCK